MITNKYLIDNKIYKVGLSIRLSREDGDDIESESISNQRLMLISFIESLGNNFELIDIYIDDGFSGLNFNRPGFKKMIRDIENGRINMVITKDLSRLGRDYIETGFYIEKYFPEHNVRYIALNDNIDTFNDKCDGADLMPFRLGMNDMYAKDISKKVRTNLIAMKTAGLFACSSAPYGYMKNPNDKHQLVPDPEAALIVKRIFNLYISGNSSRAIASILTKENIPTPITQKKMQGRINRADHPEIWKYSSIVNILKNKVYLGTLIQHTSQNINYKNKKRRKLPESDWIIKENAHEPLVDKKTFDMASTMRNKSNNYNENRRKVEYLLSNVIYCDDCKSKMSISYDKKRDRTTMNCNAYKKFSSHNICFSHYANYDKFETLILSRLRELCLKIDPQELESYLSKNKNDPFGPLNKQISDTKLKIDKLEKKIDNLYDDKENGIISIETFVRMNHNTDAQITELKRLLNEYENELVKVLGSSKTSDYKKIINSFLKMDNPTKEMINKIIHKIYITKDKTIKIHYAIREMDIFKA